MILIEVFVFVKYPTLTAKVIADRIDLALGYLDLRRGDTPNQCNASGPWVYTSFVEYLTDTLAG